MRKQVKFFESETLSDLEEEINEFLITINSERVVNVEHSIVAISHEEAAMKLYTALVTHLVPTPGSATPKPAKRRVSSPGIEI